MIEFLIVVLFITDVCILHWLAAEQCSRKKEIDRIWTALFNDTYLQKRKQQQRVCSHCGGKR
jgi:hypothetical protein